MAKHLSGTAVVHLLCCLVFLEQSLGINECLKHYSTSYKRQSAQTPGQNKQYHAAAYAVDGKDETCQKTIVTSKNKRPWFQVNLDMKVNVSFIRVTNSKRHPSSFQMYVRDDINSAGMACGRFHVLAGGETRIIRCHKMFGRSLRIVGTKTNDSLSLCEVQVFNDTVSITEGVTYDVWFNETYDGFVFTNKEAHSRGVLSSFQAPRDILDYYGAKMKTYFNAPETGRYIFNISGDNKSNLYIRNVKVKTSKLIARIPRTENLDSWTRYDSWDQAHVKPWNLTKGNVYELIALMIEKDKRDHLRVGVTFPNGTFVGPLQSRIFISEKAARSLTKNSCTPKDIIVAPTTSKPRESNTRDEISSAVSDFLNAGQHSELKFQKLAELDKLGFEMAQKLSLGERPFASYAIQIENLVFAAVSMNLSTRRGFHFPGDLQNFSSFADQGSISFPENAFPAGMGRASAVFMLFKSFKKMSEQTGDIPSHLSNYVVSANMRAEVLNDLEKPFTMRFKHGKISITSQRHCVFWIEDGQCKRKGKFGRWSDDGCWLINKNETHTTCQCNHLTKFATLFSAKQGSEEDEMNLELITYVGLSLSSVGCFVTFAVYLLLRITKTLKAIVHMNLVLALGLADLIFLLGNLVENYKEICFVSTVLAFYFYLAVFAWMLNEGIHLYFLVIQVFGRNDHRRKQYYHIFGWGVPAIFVLITAGILRYDLMDETHCWLSSKTASIWVFIGPVIFVVLVNLLILAAVLRTTMTLLRNDPGHRKEKSAVRTLAMLVPILGTTWIFGIIAFAHDSIVFQYIFAVCNAFQGFFIFILYCLFNTEVRHEYQRRRKAWKTERELDSKRSPQNNSFDV